MYVRFFDKTACSSLPTKSPNHWVLTSLYRSNFYISLLTLEFISKTTKSAAFLKVDSGHSSPTNPESPLVSAASVSKMGNLNLSLRREKKTKSKLGRFPFHSARNQCLSLRSHFQREMRVFCYVETLVRLISLSVLSSPPLKTGLIWVLLFWTVECLVLKWKFISHRK